MLPYLRWMKGQDDIFGRNPTLDQLISNHFFSMIDLNPDFPLFHIKVKAAAVHKAPMRPANAQQLVVMARLISDDLCL